MKIYKWSETSICAASNYNIHLSPMFSRVDSLWQHFLTVVLLSNCRIDSANTDHFQMLTTIIVDVFAPFFDSLIDSPFNFDGISDIVHCYLKFSKAAATSTHDKQLMRHSCSIVRVTFFKPIVCEHKVLEFWAVFFTAVIIVDCQLCIDTVLLWRNRWFLRQHFKRAE